MSEGNVGVDLTENNDEVVGQENIIQEVGGEEGAEDDSKDTYWGRRFEVDVLKKEVSDWLAGQRREQEDQQAGQEDVLEIWR